MHLVSTVAMFHDHDFHYNDDKFLSTECISSLSLHSIFDINGSNEFMYHQSIALIGREALTKYVVLIFIETPEEPIPTKTAIKIPDG